MTASDPPTPAPPASEPATPGPATWSLREGEAAVAAMIRDGKTTQAAAALAILRSRFPQAASLAGHARTIDKTTHRQAARSRFPGATYSAWLQHLHARLAPAGYLEIGVASGSSLTLARPPTRCLAIDPKPTIGHPITAWARVFAETSDAFFAGRDVAGLLEGASLDLAFIDGLHTFDQALKDFMNVERAAHPGTVVAFHDTFPVTPITAARDRQTIFWLGDTWKVVPLLKAVRPDLAVLTIPTFPSGLTLVRGLDPTSRVLETRFAAEVAAWMPARWEDYADTAPEVLSVGRNDPAAVDAWLDHRG